MAYVGDSDHLTRAFMRNVVSQPAASSRGDSMRFPEGMSSIEMSAFIGELSHRNPKLKSQTLSRFHEQPQMFDNFCHRLFGKGRPYLSDVRAVYLEIKEDDVLKDRFFARWKVELPALEKRLFVGEDDSKWVNYLGDCISCPDVGSDFSEMLESPECQGMLLNILRGRLAASEEDRHFAMH